MIILGDGATVEMSLKEYNSLKEGMASQLETIHKYIEGSQRHMREKTELKATVSKRNKHLKFKDAEIEELKDRLLATEIELSQVTDENTTLLDELDR